MGLGCLIITGGNITTWETNWTSYTVFFALLVYDFYQVHQFRNCYNTNNNNVEQCHTKSTKWMNYFYNLNTLKYKAHDDL